MTREKQFPNDLNDELLSKETVTHQMTRWENIDGIHITDTSVVTGEEYITGLVVYTTDDTVYRATWNGASGKWAIGKLVRNPDAAW